MILIIAYGAGIIFIIWAIVMAVIDHRKFMRLWGKYEFDKYIKERK